MAPTTSSSSSSSYKLKLNAAGMSPQSSMLLSERSIENEEERSLMAWLVEIFSPTSISLPIQCLQHFAPDILYTSPKGNVLVGHSGLSKLFESNKGSSSQSHRSVTHRLLVTPETVPTGSLVVDQIVTIEETQSVRSLLVLKRRAGDGLVCSLSQEEGHCRATAPLTARAASASNFHSPTDAMLSPCTSKLNLVKKKHHTKAKPLSLFSGIRPAHHTQVQSRTLGGAVVEMDM